MSSAQINVRLNRAPKFKRGEINFEKYPVEKAHENALKFL